MTTPAIAVHGPVVTMRRVTATSSRRWGVALGVALLALVGTAGAFLFAAGATPVARLAGWAPEGTVAYAEMRLDIAADRDGSTARFLANFPGFADRSRLDDKLTELGDRLLERATDGAISYSSMKPWLGDAAALAVPRFPASKSDGTGVVIVATTDAAGLRDWIATNVPAGGTTETFAGVQLTTGTHRGMTWAYTVLDTVFLAGEKRAVQDAIETAGRSSFASSERFRAALATVDANAVGFGFIDGTALAAATTAALPDGADAADLRDMLPAWVAVGLLPTDDTLRATVIAPRPALLGDAGSGEGAAAFPPLVNETSTLASRLPADTLIATEGRDVGAALVALVARATADGLALPDGGDLEGSGALGLLGLAGNVEALAGWMGDSALIVRAGAATPEAGIVALVADEAAATATTRQLRALLVLATGGEGITFAMEPYGDGDIVTLVIDDPRSLLRAGGAAVGSDSSAGSERQSVSWTVQRGLFVAGTTPEFVKAVVATTVTNSLANTPRYRAAIERAGRANAGETYLDVPALLARFVPLLPAEERAAYDRDLAPFADVLDGAAGVLLAGDPLRVELVFTVR